MIKVAMTLVVAMMIVMTLGTVMMVTMTMMTDDGGDDST